MIRPVLLLLLASMLQAGHAQHYKTAAGLRLAMDPGITVQQHLFNKLTLEAMLQTSLTNSRTSMAVLLQQHHKLVYKGLNLYFGAGPQFTSYSTGIVRKNTDGRIRVIGLALVGGLELAVNRTVFSLDYKPVIEAGGPSLFYAQAGLSARYVLVKRSKNTQKKKGNGIHWPWKQKA